MNALRKYHPFPDNRAISQGFRASFGRRSVSILLLSFLICLCAIQARAEGPKTRSKMAPSSPNVLEMNDRVVKSLKTHENFLFLDDQRYLVTPQTRCLNERGRRISWKQLPESGAFDLRYQMRSRDEESPYGSREKVLLELRVLSPPKREGSSR